jgi:predicted nuclease of restriction endonuclease-like (RecB) superfamily
VNLDDVVQRLKAIHDDLARQATRAVNLGLTMRNWLIGGHLHEYELRGEDRSRYGDRVVEVVAEELTRAGLSNCSKRQLYRYRDFFRAYPGIVGTLPPQLAEHALTMGGNDKVGTLSPQLGLPVEKLTTSISYSHFEVLTAIQEPLKRAFYELECVQGQWSLRELKRQVASLYFERSGLSLDKAKLAAMAQEKAEASTSALVIRDPYVFEFLGLRPKDVMPESDLEDGLLDKMQEFLLELGRGFCFEARQKRILIGDEHYFVDLVFYHRILKCHVLIELKAQGFSHENLGQLNVYVNWYRENMMAPGDNPPVGILLCTEKNHALVKYAVAAVDNTLFVSKYQLQLPDEEQMRTFLEAQMRKTEATTP